MGSLAGIKRLAEDIKHWRECDEAGCKRCYWTRPITEIREHQRNRYDLESWYILAVEALTKTEQERDAAQRANEEAGGRIYLLLKESAALQERVIRLLGYDPRYWKLDETLNLTERLEEGNALDKEETD